MEEPVNLEMLSEKTVHQTVDPHLIAYCPSMDLVALGSSDQQVLVYRLNGQRVYGATQKAGTLHVENIHWKPNGQLLAIAWSDGSVRLVGAESNKIVHQFATGDQVSGVTCVGWVSNVISKKASSTSSKKEATAWQHFLAEDAILSEKTSLDLPRDLSLIDIEASLPRLSVLAAGGSSEDVFCSRSSLDALFRAFDAKDNNAVDIMIVGTREGNIHLSIYDSFVVGSFTSPVMIGSLPSHLVWHTSHEQFSTHALLMESSGPDGGLYFVPMDLRFISTSSEYLSLLASRSTELQNLLRYIHQVQILMVNEWKATQDLPSKFLRNINETLAEQNNRDIVQALYHSVATGHTFPAVKEWLVDELSERGHKRWDKTVSTALENLKRLVHENMLPALERCSVILSRFAGIAKFQGLNDTVGFSSQQISLIMDTVACLHLISAKILIHVVDELDLFVSFSAWLRYEIDRLASDASSSSNDEAADKEASIDHSKVLLYLQTAMTTSSLATFFGDSSSEDYKNGWNHAEQGLLMFDLLDKQLQKQEQGLPYMKPLPRVELLCTFLSRQASSVFSQIAEAEKRNVLFGKANEIGSAQSDAPMDMRMNRINNSYCSTHVAFVPKGLLNHFQVLQITLSIENGISTVHTIESAAVHLGDGRVKDMKFSDNDILLVLWESNGETSLLSIRYRKPNDTSGDSHPNGYHMNYSPHKPNARPPNPAVFNDEEVHKLFCKHTIPSEGPFVPEWMEIRIQDGRHDKGETNRIIILGKDRLHYKVFRLADAHSGPWKSDEDISMS